ncbi:MAG TPA: hypothetical protein VG944_13040 [Fimbriimonas sp.]|nr:hypothetical protein [Fimbriimonas sp.]
MQTEVTIVGAKRNVSLGVVPRPVVWKSMVVFFDTNLKSTSDGMNLEEWLGANNDWEIKFFGFDPPNTRWVLVAQRPLA